MNGLDRLDTERHFGIAIGVVLGLGISLIICSVVELLK